MARCLVTGTDIILLDEPLANLDVHLRASMLEIFADVHAKTGATIVYVTHDQSEALALADQIVVLDAGMVQQRATPQSLYAEPANAMVAGFVGRGALVAARVENGRASVDGHTVIARGAHQTGPGTSIYCAPKACASPKSASPPGSNAPAIPAPSMKPCCA